MEFGSLFSGGGLMDLGLEQAGMRCQWQAEIDPHARRVLAHHWPDKPCHKDVRDVGKRNLAPVDLIAFGSPCQDLSVAGKRAGLAGERSSLFHEAIRIVRELRPTFVLWENVPGAFSSHGGRDFGTVIRSFRDIGPCDIAWRVFDAQYFGVPQRRRRIFLVADFGGDRAGEILFESPCGCGHPPTRYKAESSIASTIRGRSHGTGVSAPGRGGEDDSNLVTHSLQGEGFDASEDGTGRGAPLVVVRCITSREGNRKDGDTENFVVSGPICSHSRKHGHAMTTQQAAESNQLIAEPLTASFSKHHGRSAGKDCRLRNQVTEGNRVRRYMPVECCRLQGCPDDWLTLDPPLSDSAMYRILGNGCAVPVLKAIGRRILAAESRPPCP